MSHMITATSHLNDNTMKRCVIKTHLSHLYWLTTTVPCNCGDGHPSCFTLQCDIVTLLYLFVGCDRYNLGHTWAVSCHCQVKLSGYRCLCLAVYGRTSISPFILRCYMNYIQVPIPTLSTDHRWNLQER